MRPSETAARGGEQAGQRQRAAGDDLAFALLGIHFPDGRYFLDVDGYRAIEPEGDSIVVGGEPDSYCSLIDAGPPSNTFCCKRAPVAATSGAHGSIAAHSPLPAGATLTTTGNGSRASSGSTPSATPLSRRTRRASSPPTPTLAMKPRGTAGCSNATEPGGAPTRPLDCRGRLPPCAQGAHAASRRAALRRCPRRARSGPLALSLVAVRVLLGGGRNAPAGRDSAPYAAFSAKASRSSSMLLSQPSSWFQLVIPGDAKAWLSFERPRGSAPAPSDELEPEPPQCRAGQEPALPIQFDTHAEDDRAQDSARIPFRSDNDGPDHELIFGTNELLHR